MENSLKPKIITIVGPTASGKTSLSLLIAEKFSGEVINADSRQVYKGLDIGTEKITKDEMAGVPHHLLDVAEIERVYTATEFKRDAEIAIAEITKRGNIPIIAGGTFFYIDTLLGSKSAAPVPPNPQLRAKLEQLDESELFSMLEKKDPRRAAEIDKHNKRRLVRALEIIQELAHVPEMPTSIECPYDVLKIGILVDKKVLRERLRDRAAAALEKGLVEETKGLLSAGITKERLMEIGHEYRVVLEYLDGELTQDGLIQKLEEKNWQYAKRQMMWLKRDADIKWFEREDTTSIFDVTSRFLKN